MASYFQAEPWSRRSVWARCPRRRPDWTASPLPAFTLLRWALARKHREGQRYCPSSHQQTIPQGSFDSVQLVFEPPEACHPNSKPRVRASSESVLAQLERMMLMDVILSHAFYAPDTRKDILTGYFAALAALLYRSVWLLRRIFHMCLRRRYLVHPIWRRLDLQSLWWPRNELRLFPKPLARRAYKGSHSAAEKSADVDGSSITRTDWSWLEGPTVRNLQSSISSIPISLPLIGLVQLVQYTVPIKVNNLTHHSALSSTLPPERLHTLL